MILLLTLQFFCFIYFLSNGYFLSVFKHLFLHFAYFLKSIFIINTFYPVNICREFNQINYYFISNNLTNKINDNYDFSSSISSTSSSSTSLSVLSDE